MTRRPTKRERYPLTIEPEYGHFVIRNGSDDYPRHHAMRFYCASRHDAEVALLRLYKRVAVKESVAQTLGIHPLEKLPTYADGGYPLVYYAVSPGDDSTDALCVRCAERERRFVVEAEAHYEGPPTHCAQCDKPIESAYGDPDDSAEKENDQIMRDHEPHITLEEWFNPRDGTPQYHRTTELPALNLLVSTINNRCGCETMIFELSLCLTKQGHALYVERHETTDDLDAHHERIVALAQDGQLELDYQYSR